ncbi:nicotinate phosphoribosyltransferase [Marinobacter sp.]|uniref:nicotinate phosphoribosyltransferase n=1 Tax=Marinobacter sp. TaxID=50741 RepID=UPI003A92CC7D
MISQEDLPLMVDLYELAMAQAYWAEGMQESAVFSLFFRELPEHRNFVLACGQQRIAEVVEKLSFTDRHLERLRELDRFRPGFLDWLKAFRFSGAIRAVDEGTPLFPQEPLLEIRAPIAEAQILESLVMNYVHLESVLASKAVRIKFAAGDCPVVDFGMRRMHGLDAAHRGVRAYRLAGLSGTSNVLAGLDFGMQVNGTMAHSFVQAYADEIEAFKVYARLYPGTTLLVDTYDSRRAVKRMVNWLQREPDVSVGAIRLDSGDLAEEARDCRAILDDAGFKDIKIMASGGLDEYRIASLRENGAPIDGFGVGTAIGAANDAPALDLAYKLTEYAGEPKMKSSSGKKSWPGEKQVFRQYDDHGIAKRDVIAGLYEPMGGIPLLKTVMEDGKLLPAALTPLDEEVANAQRRIQSLPPGLRTIKPSSGYEVEISDYLQNLQAETFRKVAV